MCGKTDPEKLSDCDAVDRVRLLAAKDLEEHVLNVGKACRLDVRRAANKIEKHNKPFEAG